MHPKPTAETSKLLLPSFRVFMCFSKTSDDRLAAVCHERMAHNKPGAVRTEPENRVGDFLGLTHSSDGFLRDDFRPAFRRPAGEPTHHRRIDIAGTHRVDANVLRCVVERGRAREADHAVLRSRVSRA